MVNKRKIKCIIVTILILTVIFTVFLVKNNRLTDDERKFKYEYERFNGKKNLSKIKYVKIDILDKNKIKYLTDKQLLKLMEEETGVVFFGYPQSNYSRNAIVVLLDVMSKYKKQNINYYNAYEYRDEKFIGETGEIVTVKKPSGVYNKILSYMGEKADVYEGLNDNSIKRLYFPTVLFIKNGKLVKMYSGTVDTNKDNKKFTKNEYDELKKIYNDGIKKIGINE